MRKKPFLQLMREARQLRLSTPEKNRIKRNLIFIMQGQKNGKSFAIFSGYSFKSWIVRPIPLVLAGLIILGTGTSWAAYNSLPGDSLYSYKIGVNERVMDALAISQEAKMKRDLYVAEERLREAEKLATRSQLNDELRSDIEKSFNKRADRIESRLNAQTHPEFENVLAFKALLKGHQYILSEIDADENGSDSNAMALAMDLKTRAQKVKKIIEAEKEEHNVHSEPGLLDKIQSAMNDAQDKLDDVNSSIASGILDMVGNNTSIEIQAKIKAAQDLYNQAQAVMNTQSYQEALWLVQKAQSIADEARSLSNIKEGNSTSEPESSNLNFGPQSTKTQETEDGLVKKDKDKSDPGGDKVQKIKDGLGI